jgi:metallo-beta-lactamase family protein
VDGVKTISLWGETIRVAADVRTVGGFSAHADCQGLSAWYGHFKERPPVALVHGEPQAMDAFAERLKSMGARQVFTPQLGARLDLVGLKAE